MSEHSCEIPATPNQVEIYNEVDDVTLVFASAVEADCYSLASDAEAVAAAAERRPDLPRT